MTPILLRRPIVGILLAATALVPGAAATRADDKAAPRVRMLPADGDGAKYWPRWRGPTGQCLAGDTAAYPETWSATSHVLWKVAVPGRGNSSPILWNDRLYLTTARDRGKRRSILCFDRGNGKLLWETFAPEASPEKAYGKNGWASGTPCTDGARVYAYFGAGGLLCVDRDGKQVWHATFGPIQSLHGMACSPLLYKDRVIIFQEHRGGGFIAALDKLTGKELWKTRRKETVGWGSPVAISVAGRDQVIVSSSQRVYAYDPADGKVLWTCGGNLLEVIPSPTVGHDLLFCCSGRVGPTLAIRPPADAAGDVTKSAVAWRTVKGAPFVPSPLVYGDYLYTVNDMVSVVSCFQAKTGKLLWQERCGAPVKEGFSSSPIGVNGKVYVTNDEGETFVFANGPEAKLLHVNRLGARTLATPALLDGRWYWRTEGHLLCIGKK